MTLALTFPELTSDRLILRVPARQDIDAAIRFYAAPRSQFFDGPKSTGEASRDLAARAGQWVLLGYGMFAVALKQTGETIGLVGPVHPSDYPEPELSWLLIDAAYEGQGYAHEAVQRVLDYLFRDLAWSSVISYIDRENHASRALALRLGAQLDPACVSPVANCETYRHHPVEGRT